MSSSGVPLLEGSARGGRHPRAVGRHAVEDYTGSHDAVVLPSACDRSS